jgi:hypothetical protein
MVAQVVDLPGLVVLNLVRACPGAPGEVDLVQKAVGALPEEPLQGAEQEKRSVYPR